MGTIITVAKLVIIVDSDNEKKGAYIHFSDRKKSENCYTLDDFNRAIAAAKEEMLGYY
jgi:hypothetical protein